MKNFNDLRCRLCALLIVLFPFIGTDAQTIQKEIVVSDQCSFTDNISLSPDSRDLDVMVKVLFNENENTLTVSLISYRNLFVFRDDTRYKQAVKCCKINVQNLPYVAEAPPLTKFRLSRPLRKMLPKDKKNLVFNSWIQVEGMQAQQTVYSMINDFIDQTFDIKPKRNTVTFTLRDILVMEKTSKPAAKKTVYDLLFWKDLNTRYVVTIQRNPCFDQTQALQSAKAAAEGVKQAYDSLRNNYPQHIVTTQGQLDNFLKIKDTLLRQFQPQQTANPCEDVNSAWRDYNTLIDSIATFSCQLQTPEQNIKQNNNKQNGRHDAQAGSRNVAQKSLDTSTLLSSARMLDHFTNDWILSDDVNEKNDIRKRANKLIVNIEKMINSGSAGTPEQQQAVNIFRKAAQYHKSVINKRP